jgi:hypothetical protein
MGAKEIEEEAQVAMDFLAGRDKLTCHRHLMVQLSTNSRHPPRSMLMRHLHRRKNSLPGGSDVLPLQAAASFPSS